MPATVKAVPDEQISAVIAEFMSLDGPLLPMLHALQARFGHIPAAAVPLLADALNLGKAEVHGVISFYHDFRDAPSGRHVIRICRAEACQAMGGETMAERVLARLGLDWHGTTANGAVTVEPVYCLGLCAVAPSAMIDGRLVGRLDDASLDALIDGFGE